jgi:multidrug efflux pump subunit AcrB
LFKSFRQPFVIVLAFPLGLIGVVLIMFITKTNISIQSIMGIIMMVGISVSYGNILIDRINTLITGGENMNSAIINGSLDRFRPILMTAATTVFGLLPTAIGFGNADANAPLAIAVIGGTIAAALLSLYIVPVLYSLISKNKIYEK